MTNPFVAEIRALGFDFPPTGWAFCNGQLLPLSQNTALFALLGTTYGGDGKSTFALPDLQGNAPMHPGQGPGQLGEIPRERFRAPAADLDVDAVERDDRPEAVPLRFVRVAPWDGVGFGDRVDGLREHG